MTKKVGIRAGQDACSGRRESRDVKRKMCFAAKQEVSRLHRQGRKPSSSYGLTSIVGVVVLKGRKQTPAEYTKSLAEEFDLLLPPFHEESAQFVHDSISEEAATTDVARIAAIARKFLSSAIEIAASRMQEAGEAGIDTPSELKRLTDRTLENFVRCLLTPLLPIRLKSEKKGWPSIGQKIDELAEDLSAHLQSISPPRHS